ncbi:hypothetical protein STEG23_019864 [Scotinomys teguina]
MTNARTALHIAPWWSRPGSASTPTTQLPAAALVPMSWSGPSRNLLEMGPRDPSFMACLCHHWSPTLSSDFSPGLSVTRDVLQCERLGEGPCYLALPREDHTSPRAGTSCEDDEKDRHQHKTP